LPDGVRVQIPLDYDIDQLATRLRRQAVVHVCSRDFPREAIFFPAVACRRLIEAEGYLYSPERRRSPSRGRRHQVFQRDLSDTQSGWSIS